MNDFDVAQLAPHVELLNHLALLELGLVVEPEASCLLDSLLRGGTMEDRLAAAVACRRSRAGSGSPRPLSRLGTACFVEAGQGSTCKGRR